MPSFLRRREADENRSVLLYWVCFLIVANAGGWGTGLVAAATGFFLKDGLRLGPSEMARFTALVMVPAYVGFAFGFLRDRWSPLGKGDRGYLLLFAPLSGAAFLSLAFGELGYWRVAITAILLSACIRLAFVGITSFMVTVGQNRHLTGRLNSVGNLVTSLVAVVTLGAGGWVAAHMDFQRLMALMGVWFFAVALFALWKPPAVYDILRPDATESSGGFREIGRLLRHRPLWPVAGIMVLGSTGLPGGTAMFMRITNELHASKEIIGVGDAIVTATIASASLLYAFLCQRLPIRRILIGLLLVSATQLLPIGYAPDIHWMIAACAYSGFLAGLYNIAVGDLQYRACPKGLEGMALGLFGTISVVTNVLTNQWGAYLYERGAFTLSCWIGSGLNLLILALVLLTPRSIMSYEDAPVTRGEAATEEGQAARAD